MKCIGTWSIVFLFILLTGFSNEGSLLFYFYFIKHFRALLQLECMLELLMWACTRGFMPNFCHPSPHQLCTVCSTSCWMHFTCYCAPCLAFAWRVGQMRLADEHLTACLSFWHIVPSGRCLVECCQFSGVVIFYYKYCNTYLYRICVSCLMRGLFSVSWDRYVGIFVLYECCYDDLWTALFFCSSIENRRTV